MLAVVLVVFIVTRKPKRPDLPRWEMQEELLEKGVEEMKALEDVRLVKGLLRENLSERRFDFAVVAEAVSGKKVLPITGRKSGERIYGVIQDAMKVVVKRMNADDSPLKNLRRINEGSRYFEDALLVELDGMEGVSCGIPVTLDGKEQRSGYPDLKITDEETGEVYYLDPKLMEMGSETSSFRTFYFEPKVGTLKIIEDATHLLVGIEHDGVDGDWTFTGWRLVDLSKLTVRLKAEFQASNRDLYDGVKLRER